MKLKSFGCSFVYGTDLSDAGTEKIYASRKTWPALFAQHLGRDYECYARPGSGNLQILEQTLNQSEFSDSNDLFVISWTWIDRFDYYQVDQPELPWHAWATIMPVDQTDMARIYYQNLHSEYKDKLTSLIYIKTAIDTLNQKRIPFVMTYMDDLLFDARWNNSPAVASLQQYIKPLMLTFEGQTFLQWSQQQGFAVSPGLHPLDAAHESACQLTVNFFDRQKTSDPVQQVLF